MKKNIHKRYYPLSLDIEGKKVVVVGAGNIAWKKIKKLLIYKPKIEVVAKEIKSSEIAKLIKNKKINFQKSQYNKKILPNATLIIAATSNKKLNSQIQLDAKARVLVNVVDDKKKCEFICPAVIEKNGLQIAITTHGQNPKKARIARETLEKNFNIFSKNYLRLGTRSSPLAFVQVLEFLNKFRQFKSRINFVIEPFYNQGDYDKKSPIEKVSFYDRLEKALIKKEIDIALHSAKDLDGYIDPRVETLAFSKSIHPLEAFVSRNNLCLKDLPLKARIGASGVRRMEQLKKIRKDFKLVRIRGNIEERLSLIKKENLDGIIIAMAALKRLGLDFLATEIIPKEVMSPPLLQGKLAIQVRRDDLEIKKLLIPILKKMGYELQTNNV